MKVTVITLGSHGDVQPFIALGAGLVKRGHCVKIATFSSFRDYILSYGFEYAPIAGDAKTVIKYLIGEDVKPAEYFKNLSTLLTPIKDQFLKDIFNACEGSDIILYTVLGSVTYHAAEKLKIPCIRAFFCPLDPTGDFPTMTAPIIPLGKLYNKFTYFVGDRMWSNATRKHLNSWRQEMGLEKIRPFSFPYRRLMGGKVHTLYPISPSVVPKPEGWGDELHITGFWFLNENFDWQPPEDLVQFLNSGKKPIYIGFGSMVGGSFSYALNTVLESLEKTGQRAILAAGWGGLSKVDLPDYVYKAEFIPHNWLFKRVAAVIHHGGAGTTGAGLRAGIPSIIIPFGGDQPFWGEQIYRLGVGPKPIPRKKLTAEKLTYAINEAKNNQKIINKAAALGEKLRNEDGVSEAVDIIERVVKKGGY
jgi:UDP:flavonoid glycosyltransferase YjiC (YdhE family)